MSPSIPPRDKPDDRSDAPEIDQRTSRPGPIRQDAAPTAPPRDAPREAKDQPPARGQDSQAQGNKSEKRSKLPLIILGVVIVLAAIGGGYYYIATMNQESTDDAFTDGHAITVSPQVDGLVVKLAVTDNQFVHAGDLLVQIDPRDYQAARDQAAGALEVAQAQLANAEQSYSKALVQFPAQLLAAQAQVASSQANLTNAQADYRRQQSISRAATTQQSVDLATATMRQADAQLQQSKAQELQAELVAQNIAQAAAQVKQWQGQVLQSQGQLDRAELNLSYTHVTAPQDGWVTKRNVEQGNYLQAGGSIMSIVSPQLWITANFKETQLDRMRPGQRVDISIDSFPDLKLKGHLDSVQKGSGSRFTAFPAENATGNYVKIVQRVPVKIVIDSGLDPNVQLPLGVSATPTVTVK